MTTGSHGSLAGKSILVVDDVEKVRDELVAQYRAIGLNVAGAVSNGLAALEFLRVNHVDLVSLDIIMPEMDGIECYRRIKAEGMTALPFFVSWLAGDPRVADALKTEIPADLFQGKPVTESSLLDRVAKVLARPAVVHFASTPDSANAEDTANEMITAA